MNENPLDSRQRQKEVPKASEQIALQNIKAKIKFKEERTRIAFLNGNWESEGRGGNWN